MDVEELRGDWAHRVRALAAEKNAVILAHNYQVPEIQDVAHYVGDSLYLSRRAATSDADTIVFCGVHFMAETAKILAPNKTVLIPDLAAGCSLAETINSDQLRAWKSEHPDAIVISYINTTAEVKAETDIVCTSSNAVDVVNSVPANKEILFLPDQFLGAHVQRITGRENMHIWMGECHVHAAITAQDVRDQVAANPDAEILVHPECGCTTSVLYLAGVGDLPADRTHILSTGSMVSTAEKITADTALVATEVGIIHQLEKVNKHTKFIPMNARASCQYMKMITPAKLLASLENDQFEVNVAPEIIAKSRLAVEKMVAIGEPSKGGE